MSQQANQRPDKIPEDGICHQHMIKGCTFNHRSTSEQSDNGLNGRNFDELSTVLIQLCRQINPDLVYTHDDIKKARRELLAWRDKAVIDELEHVLHKPESLNAARWTYENVTTRIAQLKGGSNE